MGITLLISQEELPIAAVCGGADDDLHERRPLLSHHLNVLNRGLLVQPAAGIQANMTETPPKAGQRLYTSQAQIVWPELCLAHTLGLGSV